MCSVQLDRHRITQRNDPQALTSLTHKHSHIISQMDTQLAAEISEVCIHLRSAVSWSFTAEAADNMLPAAGAAEEPGEGGQLQDRIQEACRSCDRSTCPWLRPSGVGK